MLALYRGLTAAAGPLIDAYLRQRLAAGKEDTARFRERHGEAARPRPPAPLVWIHAASVGEAQSVLPLIDRVLAADPRRWVLITTGTVTSARLLADRLPDRAIHQYVPIDRPAAVERFLEHWRPDLAIWVESELWPNLIAATQARGVPMALIQGRMSQQSFTGWRRVRGLIAPLLARFRVVLVQSEADAARFAALGAVGVTVIGNLKFAAPPLPADPAALAALKNACAGRPLWLAASTHPGEEKIVAAVHAGLAPRFPQLLSIVVPRHPERGEAVAELARAAGLRVARRSQGTLPSDEVAFYVGDTLGELGLFYRLAGVAFVGGSLVPHGGHNLLEAARLGCALLHGPHVGNFAAVAAALADAKAALQVADDAALEAAVAALLADDAARTALSGAAEGVAATEAGVLDAVLAALEPYLPPADHAPA